MTTETKSTVIGLLCVIGIVITMLTAHSSINTHMRAKSVVAVRILENGTITHCELTSVQRGILKNIDTVWLNLETHQIDDTCSTTMKAVLLINR